ncbi:uncharacterized protein LOC126734823 [Anthonomus grandis grandis]|uniref:uncharacterized protein LOC126734823 n=1 Tax=Anthonomus grandis grandis TaxID=2921223 RepID=UPI0021663464|nr:uncharacterized protein LOC126734823 [Anthonomus grandis grandis]
MAVFVIMKIGVIGAGAAGLASIKRCLEQGHQCLAFEQTDKIGGTWNYTDNTDIDDNGLPVHSSMYQGLRTNLPKEVMEYPDFPYEEMDRSYIEHNNVLDYMHKFAAKYNLIPHIKFLRQIIEIIPLPNDKWSLKERNLKTNGITEHNLDAVMICVGNYSVPNLPNIPGSETLGTRVIHSHYYRKSDPYKGKKVLVIGAGPSGVDIASILTAVAKEVYISHGEHKFGKTGHEVVDKPLVESFKGNVAVFKDGSEIEFDNVIFCTGYQYSYPFLNAECGIIVEDNWIKYLYKHIVNIEHPTMAFIGVIFKICPLPMFDIQIRFFLEFIKDPHRFSKKEMLTDILESFNKKGVPNRLCHMIGNHCQRSYAEDLARTVQIKPLRPVIHNLFEYLFNNKNVKKKYKIINDEEFNESNVV